MNESCRISVRLDSSRATLLEKLSRQNQRSISEIVKLGLDSLASSGSSSRPINSYTAPAVPPSSSADVQPISLSNPPKMEELLAFYRAAGGGVWGERRRLLHRLIAAASVAADHQESPRDRQFLDELTRIGKNLNLSN
jgi:hypothetical protein